MDRPSISGSTNGFTLMELLVTLAIIALIANVAAVQMGASRRQADWLDLARSIETVLWNEKNYASASGLRTIVTVDVKNNAIRGSGTSRLIALPEKGSLQFRAAEKSVVSGSDARIVFNPDGTSSGGEIEFALAESRIGYRVEWLTGRITLFHPPDGRGGL